jgi:hypothetical protein
MLRAGSSWSQIQAATKCSRAAIVKIAKRLDLGRGSAHRALSARDSWPVYASDIVEASSGTSGKPQIEP